MLRIIAALLFLTASAVPVLAEQTATTAAGTTSTQTAAEETVGELTVQGFWG